MYHTATHPPRRLVLTGGPGAGKSVIARAVAAAHPDVFVLVPESATHVYTTLNVRWHQLDLTGRRDVQSQMYRHQLAQEAELQAAHPGRVLLLDRGTIDGAAYWPDGTDRFWPDVGTTHAAELARYDAVVWMQTGAALGLYDGDASNAVRFENPAEAVESGNTLMRLWGDHPRIHQVAAYPRFEDKLAVVEQMLLELAAEGRVG
jgi:predicted ATPase